MSNPFGASGHGSASQNAITINYKGKTVFGGSGYYGNFSDKHNLLFYRTSRAYSTILADSLSQKIGEEGYGWIPRSISGQHIKYALGDASNAYGTIKSEFWLDRFKQIDLDPSKTGVYGDVGVTLYRRHVLQLDGGIVILYDELEAKQPVKWTNQFHAPYYTIVAGKTEKNNQQNFTVQTDLGNVSTTVFAHSSLEMNVHNQFAEPAVNWAKVTDVDGNIKEFKDQWHAGITSLAAKKFRFLTIIQIKDGQTEIIKTGIETSGLLKATVDGWTIQAQLDGNKNAALQVVNNSMLSAFSYGNLSLLLKGKMYKQAKAGSSMLLEIAAGKLNKQEVIDEVPDVVKYDREQKK